MSTVGLTKAEMSGLQYIRGDHECMPTAATFGRLHDRGLCTPGGGQLTPRGHAALAAPRMTQAEYKVLELCIDKHVDLILQRAGSLKSWKALRDAGYIGYEVDGDYLQIVCIFPAGRTALNNVRAAMGSPDWKEGL
ncbi:hypothetical protein FHW12_000292 [Dokdonella fugitiva]|uniref:Uncharacterized protein n=1 Tax=Dokdonella fugitiva TaxID=328517 RepID=A0A839F1J8_9GAMM|nr:hypothetical protein [Dokdonella fugitiva]